MTASTAIPAFDPDGWLPTGLHRCTLDEARERLGRFQGSDRRIVLFRRLESYVDALRETSMVAWIAVDGSFVSTRPAPGDIDLVIVLRQGLALPSSLRPFEYEALSRRRVGKSYGFDILIAPDGTEALARHLAFFAGTRDNPARSKGLLRIDL